MVWHHFIHEPSDVWPKYYLFRRHHHLSDGNWNIPNFAIPIQHVVRGTAVSGSLALHRLSPTKLGQSTRDSHSPRIRDTVRLLQLHHWLTRRLCFSLFLCHRGVRTTHYTAYWVQYSLWICGIMCSLLFSHSYTSMRSRLFSSSILKLWILHF